jgi:hypothetical protein
VAELAPWYIRPDPLGPGGTKHLSRGERAPPPFAPEYRMESGVALRSPPQSRTSDCNLAAPVLSHNIIASCEDSLNAEDAKVGAEARRENISFVLQCISVPERSEGFGMKRKRARRSCQRNGRQGNGGQSASPLFLGRSFPCLRPLRPNGLNVLSQFGSGSAALRPASHRAIRGVNPLPTSLFRPRAQRILTSRERSGGETAH